MARVEGISLVLFGTGIALISALLILSYSGRGLSIACCSTAMSMLCFIGCLSLPAIDNPGHLRAGLSWLETRLTMVLDERDLVELTQWISSLDEAYMTTSREEPPIHDAVPQTASSTHKTGQTVKADSTVARRHPRNESNDTARSVVTWVLDEPNDRVSSSDFAPEYFIRGINRSDQALTEVRATLKLDSSQSEVALQVNVQRDEFGSATVIPPGAQFVLRRHLAKAHAAIQSGGAILKFRYTLAERRHFVSRSINNRAFS
jgi:hypothetical protein